MTFENRIAWTLTFDTTIPTIQLKLGLPLLIDKNGVVLLGNSMRGQFDMLQEVKCIVIEADELMRKAFREIESAVAFENSLGRLYDIQADINYYLIQMNEEFKQIQLFELPIDKSFITEQSYRDPGSTRGKKTEKKKEEPFNEGLFGGIGDR
jgi:hypothetical protein